MDDGGVSLPDRLRQIEGRLHVLETRWTLLITILVVDTILSAGGLVPSVPTIARALGL